MIGHLSRETRLEVSIKRLKTSVLNLRLKVSDLTKQLKEKDRRIAELESKLENKEVQRKELLSYLYKPSKKDILDRKPRGKKQVLMVFIAQNLNPRKLRNDALTLLPLVQAVKDRLAM